jgi:phage terminase Nu1 subunit (DNA packaging protein)
MSGADRPRELAREELRRVTVHGGEELLAPSDVARILGVHASAVSNWQKRRATMRDPMPAPAYVTNGQGQKGTVALWTVAQLAPWIESRRADVTARLERARAVESRVTKELARLERAARILAEMSPDGRRSDAGIQREDR